MNRNLSRLLRLLGGGTALLVTAWLVLLGSGILAPTVASGPVPLAVTSGATARATVTPAASFSPASPGATTAPQPERSSAAVPATGTVATRIVIDELGIDLPVYEGDGYTAELGKAAHYPTTAWPGAGTLIYLYAHAQDENFVALWEAELGDIIELQLSDGSTAKYEVSRIAPDVRWNDLSWLEPTPTEVLRLQTCNSAENTDPRFIVDAVPILAG